MSHLNVAEMSIPQRLSAMEELWESLRGAEDEVSSPDWHKDVLEARRVRVESGEAQFLTLDEVRKRLGLTES
jgi:hypothetical protein